MSTSIPNIYQKLLDSFPFLSFCTHSNNEFIGIIQNMDNTLCSMYIYEQIQSEEGKKLFLELGDECKLCSRFEPDECACAGTTIEPELIEIEKDHYARVNPKILR